MKIRELFEADTDKHVTFCFGRFNPPTLGHKEVFKKMSAQGGDMKIFTTQSQDSKKNPLDYSTKIDFIRKIHPDYAENVIEDTNLNTITKVAEYLNDQNYTHATFVGGDDRKNLYDSLVAYNGKTEGKKGPLEIKYKFETLEFISAGAREDGADGVEGISGTKAREDAANNDIKKFIQHTGAGEHADELFAAVRQGMGLSDEEPEDDQNERS
tara:strand:- start:415 stop:1050 length:636 start_codon:yes stop_codon:yes gene_type:complete